MTIDLCFCERTERNNGACVTSGILDRLAYQSLADLATAKDGRNFRVIDDDHSLTGPAVRHLRFDAVYGDPVALFRWAWSGTNERQQVGIYDLGMSGEQAVRKTGIGLQRSVANQLDRLVC